MDNKVQKIKIDEDITTKIEALQYEIDTRKDVIAFMIASDMNMETDAFKKYSKELTEFKVQYEEAKRVIEEDYVIPAMEGKKCTWSLDFYTSEVSINY